jgi:hypothetical protein
MHVQMIKLAQFLSTTFYILLFWVRAMHSPQTHPIILPSTICAVSRMRIASRAALIPLAIIAPNVGPMRFEPSCSESSMPRQKNAHLSTMVVRSDSRRTHQS